MRDRDEHARETGCERGAVRFGHGSRRGINRARHCVRKQLGLFLTQVFTQVFGKKKQQGENSAHARWAAERETSGWYNVRFFVITPSDEIADDYLAECFWTCVFLAPRLRGRILLPIRDFIPHKGNSWDLFADFRCDISPRKNFLVCHIDFRSQNCPHKFFLVRASDFRWAEFPDDLPLRENFLTILPLRNISGTCSWIERKPPALLTEPLFHVLPLTVSNSWTTSLAVPDDS